MAYDVQPLPVPPQPQPSYTLKGVPTPPWYAPIQNWAQGGNGQWNPSDFARMLRTGMAVAGGGPAGIVGLLGMLFGRNMLNGATGFLGDHAVPTDPAGTIQGSQWMNNDPSDPFGYIGRSDGPEGAMANSIEDRIAGNVENNHPNAEVGRSWQGSSDGSILNGSGGYSAPNGMHAFQMPLPGGLPPFTMIEGPKYTGAPYNPQAFANYNETGDTSWWDQWQNAPWQQAVGGGMPGGAGMPPQQPRGPADFSGHIPGSRGNLLGSERDHATDPTSGWGGGYGTGPDWSGANVYYY